MQKIAPQSHLYQECLYKGADGNWSKSFWDAAKKSPASITWDVAAIVSYTSFDFVCGDRTLVKGISRRPWLSTFDNQGQCVLSDIPDHGRLWDDSAKIAGKLRQLLYEEARKACQGRKEIYILLSGGLDSRIVAATVSRLYSEGNLNCKPIAVTWGLEDSRDVVYGRAIAKILGFEWTHIVIEPEDVLKNIETVVSLGSLFSPVHLHRMSWFERISSDSLVLIGSYGDSVGRAVYAGEHILGLNYLSPRNHYEFLTPATYSAGCKGLASDLKDLRRRTSGKPKYAICDCEMQAHYMRSMIALPMSLIGNYCTLYQMFTDPKIYSYMWSIHPSLRDNRIYANLLRQMNMKLLQLPWANTNRSLQGKTVGAKKGLRKDYHLYQAWIRGPLFEQLNRYIDPDWFAETGIFDAENIRQFSQYIKDGCKFESATSFRPYDQWVWLAGFRKFAERCEQIGRTIQLETHGVLEGFETPHKKMQSPDCWLRRILRRTGILHKMLCHCRKAIRLYLLKKKAIRKYPPQFKE